MNTRSILVGFVSLFVVGCAAQPSEPSVPPPGPAGRPDECVEDAREEVVDPSVPAEGFSVAPQAILDAVSGGWVGSGLLPDGGALDVSFVVAQAGDVPVYAVHRHLEGAPDGMGAPVTELDVACASEYLFTVDTLLTDEAHGLVAAGRGTFSTPDGAGLAFASSTPLEEVAGDLAPNEIVPEEWDEVALLAELSVGDEAVLNLTWSASREAETTSGEMPVFDSGVSTGTISPSGMSESLASLTLVRPAN